MSNKKNLSNIFVACQKGKSHKLPFPSSSTKYVELFELVVSDLWGPTSVACEGNLYYVSFVDISSRFTWIYLIKWKSQAIDCFRQFQKLIATQFGKHIKKFQSDWGGEFRAFASVLAEQGIIHRLSCPHTSEQDGVAERKHRHIMETGLTLLAQANLSMKHWGYAFSSVVHLINRLPTSVLRGQSPYQKLYGCVPQYSHLRVFGCCCFPYLHPFVGHKLDFRSQPCTFLGYSSQHKGYFCLTPDGRVIVSRHVVFDEHQFLFLSPLSDSGDPSRQSATYVPVVQVFPSSSLNPQTPPLHVASTPSPVSDSACAAVNSGVDSSSDTCVSPADVTASPSTVVSGDFRDSESVPPLSSERLIPVQVPCASSGNTHAMVTRSKAGIFKPKALTAEAVDFEPSFIDEALAHPDWKVAAQAKFDALMANSTWELVPAPPGRKVIGCKWLFKIKRNPDGSVSRRKAWLVAKGCSQVAGYDFTETFSPVVKSATIRVILSITVSRRWPLRQVDVNNAFLNGELDNEVFMHQPPGFVHFDSVGQPLVCRMKKALYGLRQAPRAWFDKLNQFLVSIGFIVSKSDASLFIRITTEVVLYILVYVDDIIITGNDSAVIARFVDQLNAEFALKDMGDLHYFLGLEVTRSSTGCLYLC